MAKSDFLDSGNPGEFFPAEPPADEPELFIPCDCDICVVDQYELWLTKIAKQFGIPPTELTGTTGLGGKGFKNGQRS